MNNRLASLAFTEIVDDDSSRVPLQIHATGTEADLLRVASLLCLGHGTLRFTDSGIKPVDITRPTNIIGLSGDHQWNHGRTAIPQGPLS